MKSVCWHWYLDIVSPNGKNPASCEKKVASDAMHVGFIKAFSSHSLVQDWLANGIADLHLCPLTSLLESTGLVWFLPCASRQWVPLPTFHDSFVATCEGSELGLALPEWSNIGARNYSHSKEFVWPWGYCMVKNARNFLGLHFPPP